MNDERNCSRDCKQCNIYHQIYCAAQSSLNTWEAVIALSNKIDAIVAEMKGPNVPSEAQEREAVQKIDSPDKQTKEK